MKISDKNKDKISEQILSYLYSLSPKSAFTVQIANEVVRDEEFVKYLLLGLEKKKLVVEIKKNPEGKPYLKRSRWKLSDAVYGAYRSIGSPSREE